MAERRNVTRKCVVAADAELDQRTVMKDDERDVRSIKPDNNIDELTSAKKSSSQAAASRGPCRQDQQGSGTNVLGPAAMGVYSAQPIPWSRQYRLAASARSNSLKHMPGC
mgnify:FL=1